MVPAVIGIVRAAIVRRVAIRNPRVPPLAVVPTAAADAAIGLAVAHRPAFLGARRIRGRADFIVRVDVPIVDPLPDVARHVVKPEAVGPVGRLVALLRAGPVEVGLAVQLAVEEADGRGPGIGPGLIGVVRFGPVGLGHVGIVAPGEIVIGAHQPAAAGVFPFGLAGQTKTGLAVVAPPGVRVVDRRVAAFAVQPIAAGGRPMPADADHGMVGPLVDDRESAVLQGNTAGLVGSMGVAVEELAVGRVDQALADPDLPARPRPR